MTTVDKAWENNPTSWLDYEYGPHFNPVSCDWLIHLVANNPPGQEPDRNPFAG